MASPETENAPRAPHRTHNTTVACTVAAIVLGLYVATAYPSITGGDAGELVVVGCQAGLAHPPGYPLFTMLAFLAIQLRTLVSAPVTAAYAVHALCMGCGAVAAALVYDATARMLPGTSIICFPAIAGSFLFAASHTVWLYAIQGEVFALNNALSAALLWLTVRFCQALDRDTQERHIAIVGALVSGLCLTNQHTTVFFVVPTVLFVVYHLYQKQLLWANVPYLSLALALGLAPYLYLPLRGRARPVDSWGNPTTLDGFLTHFLRREYGTFQLAADSMGVDPGTLGRLAVYLRVWRDESLQFTIVFAGIGVLALFASPYRAVRRANLALVLDYTLYMGVFHYLANLSIEPLFLGVQARFWQQPNIIVCIWTAAGIEWTLRTATRLAPVATVGKVLCVGLAAAQVASNMAQMNHATFDGFHVEGSKILDSMPPGAIVLLNGDLNNNVVKYPQMCEGERPDVSLLSLQLMTWPWYGDMQHHNYPNVSFPRGRYHPHLPEGYSIREFLNANIDTRPIFLCGPWKEYDDSYAGFFDTWPYGMCDRIFRAGQTPANVSRFFMQGHRGIPYPSELGTYQAWQHGADTWEHVLMMDAWRRLALVTQTYSFHSNKRPEDMELLRFAHRTVHSLFGDAAVERLFRAQGILGPDDYRAAGVIYGQYCALRKRERAEDDAPEVLEAERMMVRVWTRFVALRPTDTEIRALLSRRVNAYTGKVMDHIEDALFEIPVVEDKKKKRKKRKKKKKNKGKK